MFHFYIPSKRQKTGGEKLNTDLNRVNPLMLCIIETPVNQFALQINWLVSIRWGTLVVNVLMCIGPYPSFFGSNTSIKVFENVCSFQWKLMSYSFRIERRRFWITFHNSDGWFPKLVRQFIFLRVLLILQKL